MKLRIMIGLTCLALIAITGCGPTDAEYKQMAADAKDDAKDGSTKDMTADFTLVGHVVFEGRVYIVWSSNCCSDRYLMPMSTVKADGSDGDETVPIETK